MVMRCSHASNASLSIYGSLILFEDHPLLAGWLISSKHKYKSAVRSILSLLGPARDTILAVTKYFPSCCFYSKMRCPGQVSWRKPKLQDEGVDKLIFIELTQI